MSENSKLEETAEAVVEDPATESEAPAETEAVEETSESPPPESRKEKRSSWL